MRAQAGAMRGTVDLIWDDLAGGVNKRDTGDKMASGQGPIMRNLEPLPTGDVRKRAGFAQETLYDPTMLLSLSEPVVALISYRRVGAPSRTLVATPTRLFLYLPGHGLNLKELKLDRADASDSGGEGVGSLNTLTDDSKSWEDDEWAGYYLVDSEDATYEITANTETTLTVDGTPEDGAYEIVEYLAGERSPFDGYVSFLSYANHQGNLYIGTGKTYLIEWNGLGDLKYISKEWPSGFQKPAVVCSHLGRLALTAWAEADNQAHSSVVRFTELADATKLSELWPEVRTTNDEVPTGMASTALPDSGGFAQPGLVIWKPHSTHILLGSDLAQFTDIRLVDLDARHGCVGPLAHCYGDAGIYYLSYDGLYCVRKGQGVAPVDTSDHVMTMLTGRGLEHSNLVWHPKEKAVVVSLPIYERDETWTPLLPRKNSWHLVAFYEAGGRWFIWNDEIKKDWRQSNDRVIYIPPIHTAFDGFWVASILWDPTEQRMRMVAGGIMRHHGQRGGEAIESEIMLPCIGLGDRWKLKRVRHVEAAGTGDGNQYRIEFERNGSWIKTITRVWPFKNCVAFGEDSDLGSDPTTEESGTTGSGSLNRLTDTSKKWTNDEWIGSYLFDSQGAAFLISDNNDTSLTVSGTPASGIYRIQDMAESTDTGVGWFTTDEDDSWFNCQKAITIRVPAPQGTLGRTSGVRLFLYGYADFRVPNVNVNFSVAP